MSAVRAIRGPLPHHLPSPPPMGPIVLATILTGAIAACGAYIATGGHLGAAELVGYAYSFAQIGGGFLAIIARGKAAKMLPRANRFAFMVSLGLLIATGIAGVAHQALPSLRLLPRGPVDFIAWVQFLGFPALALVVLFHLAWQGVDQTAGDVAAFALANGDDGALKEALAVCDVVVEATGEIRKTIAAQTAKVRAAMMA